MQGVRAWNGEQLQQAFTERSPCTMEALDLWRAYTAPAPDQLRALDSAVAARILDEYPSARTGLSLTEERLLRLADGERSVVSIVAETLEQSEEPIGDILLFEKLWDFVMGEAPLLEPREESARFRMLRVGPSAIGRAVLAGECDYVECGTVNRWVGGVHLHTTVIPWRR
jgi:hypothetical protein